MSLETTGRVCFNAANLCLPLPVHISYDGRANTRNKDYSLAQLPIEEVRAQNNNNVGGGGGGGDGDDDLVIAEAEVRAQMKLVLVVAEKVFPVPSHGFINNPWVEFEFEFFNILAAPKDDLHESYEFGFDDHGMPNSPPMSPIPP